MKVRSRSGAAVLIIALSLIAMGIYAWHLGSYGRHYVIDSRTFMFRVKSSGHAPDVSWFAVLRRMGPRWMQSSTPTFAREVGSGPEPCPVLWQTPLGQFWGSREDGRIFDHLIMEELGGRIYDRAPAGLAAGDVVIDVGAHLGTFTRYALTHGASRVISVEPAPRLADCLERTFAPEIAAGRVTVARVAAWKENRDLEFLSGSQSTTGRVTADVPASIRVRGETLDSLAARLGLARVDFIKMDIEGSEPAALAGAAALLRDQAPRMAICIYHGYDHRQRIPALVAQLQPTYHVFFRAPFQAYFHR